MKTNKDNSIAISVIIPVYNVGKYLAECIESVLNQNLSLEIILINDGSTDQSPHIMDAYAIKNSNIKVYHQQNLGLPATRNRGLSVASGEYIAFVDSDDWLKKDSLSLLYQEGIKNKADIVMGNIVYSYPNGKTSSPFSKIDHSKTHIVFSGKKGFCELMKVRAYPPMVCNYIYKREWLIEQNFRFYDLLHEDELWTPVALCKAPRMVMINLDFYYYRQHSNSIMNTLKSENRVSSLLTICDHLMTFANRNYTDDKETYSWLYVKIYELYHIAFLTLSLIQISTYKLPNHHLHSIFQIYHRLEKTTQARCLQYYSEAKNQLKTFRLLRLSPLFNISIPDKKKILILIYNQIWEDATFPSIPKDIPDDYIVTLDRSYLSKADAVIFHIPSLFYQLEDDLNKPDKQIWVAWSLECEENYPVWKDSEFMELFDLTVSYHQHVDIIFPYYRYTYLKELYNTPASPENKTDKCCMVISSPFNKSKREEYLQELMEHTEIDSYGSLFKNAEILNDRGKESKMEIYSKYKFVIAFENSIATDYVTEKFFDPLLAGTVPIYLGAPNIKEYEPGNNCFINVRDYESPQQLAEFINSCYRDEALYAQFFNWKNKPLSSSFQQKAIQQKTHPFILLCNKIKKKKMEISIK